MALSSSQLMVSSAYFLVTLIPYIAPMSFNLENIGAANQNTDIITQGNGSYISDQGLQVTSDVIGSYQSQRAARAIYIRPLRLWDKATKQLADFTTNFTFVINSNRATSYGSGFTFFLAANNSVISTGAAMGLPLDAKTFQMKNLFVAVEFDTYCNGTWDPLDLSGRPLGDHVGINVNNLASVMFQKWLSNIPGGRECQAWIKYDSASKNLSVAFTGFQNNTLVRQVGLDYSIDLRDVLPESVIFGFSAATEYRLFEKHTVKSWAFTSSDLQIDENKQLPPTTSPYPTPTTSPYPTKGKQRTGLVVGSIAGSCILVAFVSAFVVWKKKANKKKNKENKEDEVEELRIDMGTGSKRSDVETNREFEMGTKPKTCNMEAKHEIKTATRAKRSDVEMNHKFEMGIGPKKISFNELAQSTSDFAEKEKLGEGGFGGVYRGFFKDSDTYVAVKRVSKTSEQGVKEYASEVTIISQLRHRNLVRLIGWCHEHGELLLVYEFMANRSLDTHLYEAKSFLTWGTRYKIARGLASALLYLHEEWEQCVLHRDIKSSNVMLDSSFNAKLGDFGLAKLVDHEKGSKTTMLAGTTGYIAPECVTSGKVSKETDMYSFGIVALEIACGRRPIESNSKPQGPRVKLVESVWALYETGTIIQAADPRLGADFKKEEIECLMIVGLWCAHPNWQSRPSVRQALQVLNFEASLPDLPSKMPVATYDMPPKSPYQSSSSGHNTDSSMFTASSATSTSESASLIHSMQ